MGHAMSRLEQLDNFTHALWVAANQWNVIDWWYKRFLQLENSTRANNIYSKTTKVQFSLMYKMLEKCESK